MNHNNKPNGFFLFSFSIYLACIFLLCSLLFLLLAISYQQIVHLSKNNEELQSIEKAQWHIIRLLENASHDTGGFPIIKNDHLVWSIQDDIWGLMYDPVKKKLYYVQGSYNSNTHQMSIREKNLVLEKHKVSFRFSENPFFIMCSIESEQIIVRFFIKPRRGTYKT